MSWLEALILGAVQGLTEFLPVSSDGHLNLVQKLFDRATGRVTDPDATYLFFVVLHVGTLAAILAHYRREVLAGLRGLFGAGEVPEMYRRAPLLRLALLVGLSTAVLIPDKLFFMPYILKAFEGLAATGVGFWITAGVLAVTASRLSGGDKGPAETTPLDALIVGVAQAFAPLPGVSRSGLTIAAALALGFRRAWAVQYSLMLAVPAILGASALELKDVERRHLDAIDPTRMVVATVLAGLVGYAAIVWLARVVKDGRLWYFSVYLAVLGLAVIVGESRRPSDAPNAPAPAGRSPRADAPRPADRRVPARREGLVDRPVRARPGPGGPRAGPGRAGAVAGDGVDLG